MLRWPNKDPQDISDFGIDGWEAHLGDGDTLDSATWSVSPSGLTLDADSATNDTDKASIWVSGGSSGVEYTVTCRGVSAGGRQMDRSARLLVTDR
jgi:hypothetical protein